MKLSLLRTQTKLMRHLRDSKTLPWRSVRQSTHSQAHLTSPNKNKLKRKRKRKVKRRRKTKMRKSECSLNSIFKLNLEYNNQGFWGFGEIGRAHV
jgi:hypothetical protein